MLDPIKDVFRLSGLPDPALHVVIGLAIYLVSRAVLRLPWRNWTPWFILLGMQLINEVADVTRDVLDGEVIRWRGSLFDTLVTMALPTLIVLFGKSRHQRSRKARD